MRKEAPRTIKAMQQLSQTTISEVQRLLGDLPKKSLLSHYYPKEEWFLRKEAASGIHGITHMLRVLVLQEVLSAILINKYGLSFDRRALRWAAITHDLRRSNEFHDPQHPMQAALWVGENLEDVIPAGSLKKVVYINRWHSSGTSGTEEPPDIIPELSVLKDADILDRIRLGKKYFDPVHLHYDISRELLIQPAKSLFEISFKKKLQGKPPANCVMDAAVELGLIANR